MSEKSSPVMSRVAADFTGWATDVPFSQDTKLVQAEVPLVRFLAERVIIATAS